MAIQKKSLISTLKASKKANVAAEHKNKGEKQVSAIKMGSLRMMKATSLRSFRTTKVV